ncbi:hypothetical protein BT67DRAFT_148207 [Trichocladium antarcticum]|uniref:Uncharacterized protein n=1 Tax=Trichocladium antarcticum TaxID=1450529 RepID=A0AAN6UFI7_9PEZI|nr:hypothetical protein BT67DRAFT_148207 [Trichocladium antarcticum]
MRAQHRTMASRDRFGTPDWLSPLPSTTSEKNQHGILEPNPVKHPCDSGFSHSGNSQLPASALLPPTGSLLAAGLVRSERLSRPAGLAQAPEPQRVTAIRRRRSPSRPVWPGPGEALYGGGTGGGIMSLWYFDAEGQEAGGSVVEWERDGLRARRWIIIIHICTYVSLLPERRMVDWGDGGEVEVVIRNESTMAPIGLASGPEEITHDS